MNSSRSHNPVEELECFRHALVVGVVNPRLAPS